VRAAFAPWQVWWIDFDPTQGREHAKKRPGLIVSSSFHLGLTRGDLLTVLPLTSAQRSWAWRPAIQVPGKPASWVITEQIRTVSAARISGNLPIHALTTSEISAVRGILRQMIDI
jgi:mRNA interferase MazF